MDQRGLKAKNHSKFSNVSSVIQQNATNDDDSRDARIASELRATETQIQAANSVISNPSAISSSSKVTKQIINALLAPAKALSELLALVSEAIPPTQPVAELFRALLRLELDRRDNDKQIAVLYLSMSTMLVVLAKLDAVFAKEDDLTELLDQKLDEIVKLLNEFGNFCDVYYKNRTVVRFLRVTKYMEALEGFARNFTAVRHDLEALISHQTTLTVLKTSDVVDSIASDVQLLTKFMCASTTREREAQALVKAKGGVEAVLQDEKLLAEVSAKLGETINASLQTSRSLQYALHADLEVQLKENRMFFTLKLQCVRDEITESINRSTSKILLQLDAGPHEVINDPDIKVIWKAFALDMKWRNSVKARHFVSAVHHHFEQSFIQYALDHEGTQHPDLWTLNYMSRVIFYPAIGDAIDEDSSGFVSLNELNHFFDSRPEGWSAPQWIAYWAAGWYKDNLQYRDKIMARLGVLRNSIDGLHADNKEALKEYLDSIETDIKCIAESLYNNVLDYFEDDSAETIELEALREKYTEHVTKEVEETLTQLKFELDDKRTLSRVIGLGNRLESRILCVIHRLLKRHHKMFDIGKNKPLQGGVTVAMTNSFQVVFEAFTKRTRSLMESWRQQRMDVELQAEWYANGLFEDWYKRERDEPETQEYDDEDLTDDEEEEGTEAEENDIVEYATRPPTAAGTEAGSTVEDGAHGKAGVNLRGDEEEDQEEDEDKNEDEDEDEDDGNEEDEQDEGGNGEDEDDEDEEEGSEAAHNGRKNGNTPRTAHERQVDARLARLEHGMKDLKNLMIQILRRLPED
ncbi:hypothetical protein BDV93DRAFT_544465 [Ceratobasidium sp. AG-I]|nr:hypothetical protein BDV93DRAFT_544465 [Ceratobasidium sp. AG-I]